MKLRQLKSASLLMVVALSLGVFTGCGSKPEEKSQAAGQQTSGTQTLSGSLTVVGSTSVTPLAEQLAELFTEKNPDVSIDVQGVGSTAGVKATHDGSADIGMASRGLKDEEKAWNLKEHVIAYDGIAVILHPTNSVSDLSKEQIQKIFKGEIKNWKEVGGKDQEIVVVTRESGSGTRGAFEEITKLEEKDASGNMVSLVRADALVAEGNGSVKANIASKEAAIGYISLSFVDKSVKAAQVEGIEATAENVLNKSYKISRPFLMLTSEGSEELSNQFIEFILSEEGQEVVGEHYIPVK